MRTCTITIKEDESGKITAELLHSEPLDLIGELKKLADGGVPSEYVYTTLKLSHALDALFNQSVTTVEGPDGKLSEINREH